MNVYVRETARELCRMGAHVDVFTRSQNSAIPRVVEMGHGARVIHLSAGPQAPMPREEVHAHLGDFVAGVEQFRREQGLEYDLIHAHYWLWGEAVRWAAEHRWPCVAEKICELYSTLRPAALRHLTQGRCFT